MTDSLQPTLVPRTLRTRRHTTHYLECGPARRAADDLPPRLAGARLDLARPSRTPSPRTVGTAWLLTCAATAAPPRLPPTTPTPPRKSWRTWRNCTTTSAAKPAIWVGPRLGQRRWPGRWPRMSPGAVVASCWSRCRIFPTRTPWPTLVPLVDRSDLSGRPVPGWPVGLLPLLHARTSRRRSPTWMRTRRPRWRPSSGEATAASVGQPAANAIGHA